MYIGFTYVIPNKLRSILFYSYPQRRVVLKLTSPVMCFMKIQNSDRFIRIQESSALKLEVKGIYCDIFMSNVTLID